MLQLGAPLAEYIPADGLMRHIESWAMQGLLNNTVVQPGQIALLLLGGRLDHTLRPGKHSIGNRLSSRTWDAAAVLLPPKYPRTYRSPGSSARTHLRCLSASAWRCGLKRPCGSSATLPMVLTSTPPITYPPLRTPRWIYALPEVGGIW